MSNKNIVPAGIMGYYGYNSFCSLIGCIIGMMITGAISEMIKNEICAPFNDAAVDIQTEVSAPTAQGVTLQCDVLTCPDVVVADSDESEGDQASADQEDGCQMASLRDVIQCPCDTVRRVQIDIPGINFPQSTDPEYVQGCMQLFWNGGKPEVAANVNEWVSRGRFTSAACASNSAASEAGDWMEKDTLLLGTTKQEFKDWCQGLVDGVDGAAFACILGAVFSCLCCACLCGGGGFLFQKGQQQSANS